MAKEKIDLEEFFTQLIQRINEVDGKCKINKNKIDLLNQSLLKRNKKIDEEIISIKNELNNIKTEIEKINQKVEYLISELPNLVKREDLVSIEKFISLWKPLKFATIQDVERIIEKKIKK